MKRLFKKFFRKIIDKITPENVQIISLSIVFLILLVLIWLGVIALDEISELINLDVFVSAFILVICILLADLLKRPISKYVEDANKLIDDYSKLYYYYPKNRRKMLNFLATELNDNDLEDGNFDENILKIDKANIYNIIPVTTLCFRKLDKPAFNFSYKLNDNKEYYLPESLVPYAGELNKAHEKSNILFNSTKIRMDDFIKNKNDIEIKYSYTTYFNHLFTNRAMDYHLSNGSTVRNMFEPGPYLKTINQSELSNHIGFNGFVEFSDEKIIFIKRKDNLSTNKKLWQPSVSGSLKPEYCLDSNKLLSNKGISNSIKKEIMDELKIGNEYFEDQNYDFTNSIFAYYRDLIEGGKPHFVFYYKFNTLTSYKFENNFKEKYEEEKKEDNKNAKIDGTCFRYFSLEQLNKAKIVNGALSIGKRKYSTSASYLGALKLFLLASKKD